MGISICSRRHQVRHLRQHLGGGRITASLCFGPELRCLVPGDDGLDPSRRHSEIGRQLDVLRAEEVDEGVDAMGTAAGEPFGQPLAVGDRDDAVGGQPLVIALRPDPEDGGPLGAQELDDHGADPSRRGRDRYRVALTGPDGPHGGVGGAPDDVEGAGDFPAELRGFRDQLGDRDGDVVGLAGALPGPPHDFVTRRRTPSYPRPPS